MRFHHVRLGAAARAVLVGTLLSVARSAAAAPPEAAPEARPRAVALQVNCAAVDESELLRLVRIELGARYEGDVQRADIVLVVDCADHAGVILRGRTAHSPPVRRELAASDVTGDVGARVVSLAAIELLTELERSRPAFSRPERSTVVRRVLPSTPPPPARQEARGAEPALRLMATGGVVNFEFEALLWSTGLALEYVALAPLTLRLDTNFAQTTREETLGTVRGRLLSAAAQVAALATFRRWHVRAGAGVRAGSATISGSSATHVEAREGSVTAAWGGPLLALGAGLSSGQLVTELGLEGGIVALPVRGHVDDGSDLSFERYWTSIALNVGHRF